MYDIIPDAIAELEKTEFPCEVVIAEGYPPTQPDFTKALIFIREIQNTVDLDTYSHKENYSNIAIEIEIYSRAQMIDGEPKDANRVLSIIKDHIDTTLANTLCFIRSANVYTQPAAFDESVKRAVLTYEVTVDAAGKYCYRGLI